MLKSLDAEIKQRLHNWRLWSHFKWPGGISSENHVSRICNNTALSSSHYHPRPEPENLECEETENWVQDMLAYPDTYFSGLAVWMRYQSHEDTPTERHAEIFPRASYFEKFINAGGDFDEFSDYIKRMQRNREKCKTLKERFGVKDRWFAENELAGRQLLIGRLQGFKSSMQKEIAANCHKFTIAHS